MDASILDYNLPQECIARFPSEKRDESRLLVFERESKKIRHAIFRELVDILPRQYNFFRNDAAVLKGRIFAKKTSGGNVECLLLTPIDGKNIWSCMLKPGKRLPVGSIFAIDGAFTAKVLEKSDDGSAIAEFTLDKKFDNVVEMSEALGVVPLPPYIAREQNSPYYDRNFDNLRYETVYADPRKRVAAAAPTAGLHFTKELVDKLKSRGNAFYNLTLNVGIGTFQPLKSDIVEEHKMHAEIYNIPSDTLKAMGDKSRPRLAVGTTSLRAMEDYCRKHSAIDASKSVADSASLFVYPPQTIISADAMITNFHLPRSTLMCLVGTFIEGGSENGIETLKELYAIAIKEKYNFYSYGDAMLII